MNANLILKITLRGFWSQFGGSRPKGVRKTDGVGFSRDDKMAALIYLSNVVIPYQSQTTIEKRRKDFEESKMQLHPWKKFGICFVCGRPATARHHIIQLQNGGINSKKNLVSLCDPCHAKIHPWL